MPRVRASISTSWFWSSSVNMRGLAASRFAPSNFTKFGWLISLRIWTSCISSFKMSSLLPSCSRSTFSCLAATKLPFQLAMDTVLLQVVQSSFFTMTSLGSTDIGPPSDPLRRAGCATCGEMAMALHPVPMGIEGLDKQRAWEGTVNKKRVEETCRNNMKRQVCTNPCMVEGFFLAFSCVNSGKTTINQKFRLVLMSAPKNKTINTEASCVWMHAKVESRRSIKTYSTHYSVTI